MTMHCVSNMNIMSVMGFSYFSFILVRFFAGLFAVPKFQFCPERN